MSFNDCLEIENDRLGENANTDNKSTYRLKTKGSEHEMNLVHSRNHDGSVRNSLAVEYEKNDNKFTSKINEDYMSMKHV